MQTKHSVIEQSFKHLSSSSLAERFPEVAKYWHRTRNDDFTPDEVHPEVQKEVWWLCNKASDHKWQASVTNMTRERGPQDGVGCPFCAGKRLCASNFLQAVSPDVANLWYGSKNIDLTVADVTSTSTRKVW